jgi:hypothetical protein
LGFSWGSDVAAGRVSQKETTDEFHYKLSPRKLTRRITMKTTNNTTQFNHEPLASNQETCRTPQGLDLALLIDTHGANNM